MYNRTSFLGIIPARGGSKRLPRKNLLNLNGKPLIAWTIEAAKKSKYLDKIILSTDDDEISSVGLNYNIDVPFKRPKYLSGDNASTIDVIFHTLNYIKSNNMKYDCIVLLQPTSPLRDEKEIDLSIEYFMNKNAHSIISVSKLKHPIEWAKKLPKDLSMTNFLYKNKRSQDYEPHYLINGAIYIVRTIKFIKEKQIFFPSKCFAYKMSEHKSIDIDDEFDFNLANFFLKNVKK